VSRVHGLVDRYSGRSTMDSRLGQGGVLAGAWHAAATGGRELAAEIPREEGDRGELHHGVGGRRGGAAWPGGGGPRRRLEHGERELGEGLDAVERWGALGRFI
jgi:hypothetical protein